MPTEAGQNPANVFDQHQKALDLLIQQHNSIVEAEEALREKRADLLRTMTELGELHLGGVGPQDPQADTLRQENAKLRQLVSDRDHELAEAAEQSTGNLAKHQEALAQLESEIKSLRQQIQKKDTQIQELQAKAQKAPAATPEDIDIEEYEAELNEFRRQLESDRQSLNEEIQQLRLRNTELNEAARQAELELSRERASLARERAQLDRLREEIRLELERAQRDAGVRERLASVQRLKDKLIEK